MMHIFHSFSSGRARSGSRYGCICVKAQGHDTSDLQCCKQQDAEGERFDLQRHEQEASFGLLDSLMLSSEDSSADPMGDH